MNKKDKYDDMFDHILKYVSEERMEDMANDYPSGNEFNQEPSLSPEFNSHMQSYFKKLKRKGRTRHLTRVALKVAIFIIVIMGVSTAVVFNVEALRVPFLNLFNENGDESITINVRDEKADYNSYRDQISGMYLPTYIPEGYFVDSISRTDALYAIIYKNHNDEEILFKNLVETSSVVIDNEEMKSQEMTVNDEPAKLYEKNDTKLLIFKYKDNYFMMSGTVSKDELFLIAESIEYYP